MITDLNMKHLSTRTDGTFSLRMEDGRVITGVYIVTEIHDGSLTTHKVVHFDDEDILSDAEYDYLSDLIISEL